MLNVNIFFFGVMNNLDCPEPWQMGFQDPATPVMEGIIDFHHDVMFFLEGKILHSNKFCNSLIVKTNVNIKTSKY